MSFIEQASRIFQSVAELKFQAALFGREAFYIEGARPIRIDKTEMIFKTSGALIHVTGENMTIKELDGDCTAVIGRIAGFTVNDL